MVHRDQDRRPKRSALGNIVQALVERTFAWISRNRSLARDFEATVASATAFLYAASIMLLIRSGSHANP